MKFSTVISKMRCFKESRVGNDVRFVNHLVLDFVRIHEAESANASGGVRACRACKSEQPAMAVCKQCASDLCKNCVQAHRDMKLFDGHTVSRMHRYIDSPIISVVFLCIYYISFAVLLCIHSLLF